MCDENLPTPTLEEVQQTVANAARRIHPDLMEQFYVPFVLALSEDADWDVRTAALRDIFRLVVESMDLWDGPPNLS